MKASKSKNKKGNVKLSFGKTGAEVSGAAPTESPAARLVHPDSIKGVDDAGNYYASHSELEAVQLLNRTCWYQANKQFWIYGGYGGLTDDEAMIGDEGGVTDGEEGLNFLDRLISLRPTVRCCNAIDAGAGVGRITKLILLKRFENVRLIEADSQISKRSRVYLGRKRAERCTFTCSRLEESDFGGQDVDLVWLQWTLQYLTDADVVCTLVSIGKVLSGKNGILVVKENRPYGSARSDRFQMETPSLSGRYDITRTDAHHRLLFQRAGLQVDLAEVGEETNTYAVSCCC
jgi:SAM-dependent methyltransferase